MTMEEFVAEEARLLHAIQTGISYEFQYGFHGDSQDRINKHLRVGMSNALIQHGALAGLLIKKGVITQDEYFEATLELLRDELAMTEKRLQDYLNGHNRTGAPSRIKLL